MRTSLLKSHARSRGSDSTSRSPEIIFCVRHEIDLDHSAPLIDRLTESQTLLVGCIIFNVRQNFRGDWRIKHLQKNSLVIYQATELVGSLAFLRRIALREPQSPIGFFGRLAEIIFNRLLRAPAEKLLQQRIDNVDCIKLFAHPDFSTLPKIIIFDHKRMAAYDRLCNFARQHSIRTISIPHGPAFASPRFIPRQSPASSVVSARDKWPYDYVIASDRFQADGFAERGLDPLLFGEPRFDEKWVMKLAKLIPPFESQGASTNPFRVLYFSKKSELGRHDEDQVMSALDKIASTAGTQVIVKGHPRAIPVDNTSRPSLTIASADIPSSALIRWADLILFTHTSMVLEAVLIRKPVLYLKFAVKVVPNSESVHMGWEVNSQEELLERFKQQKNRTVMTYSEEARDQCLRQWTRPCDKDVVGLYTEFFASLLN